VGPFTDFAIEMNEGNPMRNPLAKVIVASLAVLSLSLLPVAAQAQGRGGRGRRGGRALPPGFVAAGVPKMPGPVGPAPKHDFTGVWVGPIKVVMGPYAPMTAAGEAAFKLNHPIKRASDSATNVAPTNDPFAICDPLGFPRDLLNHWLSSRGGIWFNPTPDGKRMLMLFEQQRVWREIWMDGRQPPAKVDAVGYPDSRYYGYSSGHWDGDNTLVIDTTGIDPSTWLDEAGLPHSSQAKLQTRWTRVDQYNLEATVTVDDPKYFTKPFQLMKTAYYWKKDQDVQEELCIPSQALEYQRRQSGPSGYGYDGR
jgi:hypothetical protein